MTVLNSSRIIDGCGNTAADPFRKTCSIIIAQSQQLSTIDFCILGALIIVAILAIVKILRK
jgi:hypothetical protein